MDVPDPHEQSTRDRSPDAAGGGAWLDEARRARARPTQQVLDCPCGVRIVGSDPDELVIRAREHLGSAHPGREYTTDEILFLASTRRVPEATTPADPAG